MSRIGRQPIPVPSNVKVEIVGSNVKVNGPLGTLVRDFHEDMSITPEDGTLLVTRPTDDRLHRSLHGLTRALLSNMVVGVSEGFTKVLEMVGVGYRAQQQGAGITIAAGFTHPVEMEPVTGVTFTVEGNNRILVQGSDREAVGQAAALIRGIRPPNSYTGKGIRYSGEIVRLKAGKAAAGRKR
jgi:large subunit ribosomal protein L6